MGGDGPLTGVFGYDGALLDRFPTTVGGILVACGVASGPSPPALVSRYREEQQSVIARLGETPLSAVPSLTAWRRVFTAFGVEPTRYRSAAEALLRRLTKEGRIPSLGLLVDVGNLVSIRYAMPVAVLDRRAVTGRVLVRFAEGSERFADLGSDRIEHPDPGEVIFVDEAGAVHARRWCWRQSAESAARPETTSVLIAVEGHHASAEADVRAALADLEALLAELAGTTAIRTSVLSGRNPLF